MSLRVAPRPAGSAAPGRLRRSLLAVAGALPLLAACSGEDPFAPKAAFETALDSYVVYPLTGTSPLLPTALNFTTRSAVRPAVASDGSLNFDLAFDVDAQGRVVLTPPKLVATGSRFTPVVGLQLVATPFDTLGTAPKGTYRTDSVTVVSPRQTVVVEAITAVCSSVSAPLYAKLVVDSVVGPSRAIYLRARVDPNCGFRSLLPGLPKS